MIQNNFFSHLSTLSVRNNFLHLFSYIVYAIFSVITSQICCSGRVNSSLKSGESYGNMKKSIVVSIIESKLFPKDIGCHSIFSVREQNTGHRLCDRLEFHFLALGKVDPRKPLEEICAEFIQRLFPGKKEKDYMTSSRVMSSSSA